MPPKKLPTVESGGSRVTTRASNVDKHPGTEAKKTLQVVNRRAPEVIQADKDKKKAAKEAKEEARQSEAAQREIAQQNLEAYRARQASLQHEDDLETFPQQQPEAKGKSTLSSILSLMTPFINRQQTKPNFQNFQFGVGRCKVCWHCF
jgi:hypothetical protein